MRLVERELIPHLRLGHPPHRLHQMDIEEVAPGANVAEMVALALAHDAAGMIACADRILACGICLDSLLLKGAGAGGRTGGGALQHAWLKFDTSNRELVDLTQ